MKKYINFPTNFTIFPTIIVQIILFLRTIRTRVLRMKAFLSGELTSKLTINKPKSEKRNTIHKHQLLDQVRYNKIIQKNNLSININNFLPYITKQRATVIPYMISFSLLENSGIE